ncbi:MAG: hypothetical protein RSB41_04505 [Bacilli bacterium]
MDENFEFLFDGKVTRNIKNSFDDIEFTKEFSNKIKEEVLRKRTLKERVNEFLNYELELNVAKIGVVASLLIIIPTLYSINEGRKIIKNNIDIIEIVNNSK